VASTHAGVILVVKVRRSRSTVSEETSSDSRNETHCFAGRGKSLRVAGCANQVQLAKRQSPLSSCFEATRGELFTIASSRRCCIHFRVGLRHPSQPSILLHRGFAPHRCLATGLAQCLALTMIQKIPSAAYKRRHASAD
jgi:hypothetical protein